MRFLKSNSLSKDNWECNYHVNWGILVLKFIVRTLVLMGTHIHIYIGALFYLTTVTTRHFLHNLQNPAKL